MSKFYLISVILYVFLIAYSVIAIDTKKIATRRLGNLEEIKPEISMEAPRGKDVEDKLVFHRREDGSVTLGLTPKQTCDICHATYDTGVVLLRRGLTINKLPYEQREALKEKYGVQFMSSAEYQPSNGKLSWPSDSMAEEICETSLAQFKPHYTIGCHQLLAAHHDKIWTPYKHKSQIDQLSDAKKVLENKLDFCVKTKSCTASIGLIEEERPTFENTPKRTPCQSCIELANDSRFLFKRLMTTIPNPNNDLSLKEKCVMPPERFQSFASMWCQSLNMRHFKHEDLEPVCKNLTNSDLRNAFYQLVRDGNQLHRFLKEPKLWEQSLCVELSNICTQDEYDQTYNMWENAAEFDYNLTVSQHLLEKQLQSHKAGLTALEEEYFFTDKHMYAPDPSTLTESERLALKEDIDLVAKINKMNDTEELSLDDIDDNAQQIQQQQQAKIDDLLENEEIDHIQEEDLVSPSLGKILLGKLSHVDADGIRIPNELPPHKLREYKAKRHKLLHDAQTASRIQGLRDKFEQLSSLSESYQNQRRVSALPDSLFVAPKIADIITNVLELQRAKKRGKIAEDLIKQTYAQQLQDMQDFSANFSQDEYQQIFELDSFVGDNDIYDYADSNKDVVIDNEAQQTSFKDEL